MRVVPIKSWQVSLVVLLGAIAIVAQTPPALRLTATTQNVSGAGEAIKITISNWSTDAQKDTMIAAWTMTNATNQADGGRGAARGGGGGGGAGANRGAAAGRGGRGGRGATPAADAAGATAAAAADVPPDPDVVDPDPDSPAARFGRGGARDGASQASAATPEAALATALKKAPSLGTFWTSETVGYSIKYAHRENQPGGGERIVIATDRRVGVWNSLWKPAVAASATDYPFSVIELHLNAAGDGEGRGAVVGKVTVDSQSKTIALDSYSTLPVIFKGVKRQNGN